MFVWSKEWEDACRCGTGCETENGSELMSENSMANESELVNGNGLEKETKSAKRTVC